MDNEIKISILIPVYNEEESIYELYQEVASVMNSLNYLYEIIFIDDGSTDKTLSELKKIKAAKIISFTRNFGKSQALQAGFDEAQGDYIITLDGDLQDDPKEIPHFIEKVEEGFDLVCGWKQKRADPLVKKIVSRFANYITRKFTGIRIHDMNCCFKIYKRDVIKNLRLYGDMHRYIPSIATNQGFKLSEIKVNHRARRYGKTKYGISRLISSLFDFFTLIFLKRFIDRPMHFFGGFGLFLSAVGFIILIYLTYLKIFTGLTIGNRPLLILGVLLMIVGFQFLSLGLIGELIIRQISDKKRFFVIKEKINNVRIY